MNLLIVSATHEEIVPLLSFFKEEKRSIISLQYHGHSIDILKTGVGMMQTAFHLSQLLANAKYDMAINIGIAGSFRKQIKMGDVVIVKEDRVGDLGNEEGNGFQDLFDMGIMQPDEIPYENGKLINRTVFDNKILNGMQSVSGISVNKVLGNVEDIEKVALKYNPDVESMEGAAFFYCCLLNEIPCVQIRAISNYVGPRNDHNWNIPLAVEILNKKVLALLEEIKL